MSTLRNISNYFRLKQLEDMIIASERRFETLGQQLGIDRETALYELRLISMITGRQTESTERIVRLFNPNADIYVGNGAHAIDDFTDRVRKLNSDPDITVRYINLNSKNIKNTIPNIRGDGVNRVWLDVGGHGLYRRGTVINCIIRTMDETFTDSNPMYIIV